MFLLHDSVCYAPSSGRTYVFPAQNHLHLHSKGFALRKRNFSLIREWNAPKHVGGARYRHEIRVHLVSVIKKLSIIYKFPEWNTSKYTLCVRNTQQQFRCLVDVLNNARCLHNNVYLDDLSLNCGSTCFRKATRNKVQANLCTLKRSLTQRWFQFYTLLLRR